MKFLLVCIFLFSVWIQENTDQINTEKYRHWLKNQPSVEILKLIVVKISDCSQKYLHRSRGGVSVRAQVLCFSFNRLNIQRGYFLQNFVGALKFCKCGCSSQITLKFVDKEKYVYNWLLICMFVHIWKCFHTDVDSNNIIIQNLITF